MNNKKLYFGASKGKSLISKFIKWFQWGDPHTHTFYIPESQINLNNPKVIEAWHKPMLKGGAVRNGLFFDTHSPETPFDILYLEVTEEQYINFEAFMNSKLGFKYDFLGFAGFATRSKVTEQSDKYFCSELVFAGLISVGIEIFKNTVPQEVSPAMFIKSPMLIEYKGLPNVRSKRTV